MTKYLYNYINVAYKDTSFKFNSTLLDICRFWKKQISDDWDLIGVCDGIEGSGKSHIIQQLLWIWDNTFNIENIVYNPKKLSELIDASEHKAIMYDEAFSGLAGKSAMHTENIELISVFTKCRYKRNIIILCIPNISLLEPYIRFHRVRFLIHVVVKKPATMAGDLERGYFKFYTESKKNDLLTTRNQMFDYETVKPNFIGKFEKFWCIDSKEYEKKKMREISLKGLRNTSQDDKIQTNSDISTISNTEIDLKNIQNIIEEKKDYEKYKID